MSFSKSKNNSNNSRTHTKMLQEAEDVHELLFHCVILVTVVALNEPDEDDDRVDYNLKK